MTEQTPHGMKLAPREYRITYRHSDGGSETFTRFSMDGYSVEDALKRARMAGWVIPAASVHQVKCIGERVREESPLTPTGEREEARQRIYDFMRSIDPEAADALAEAEKQVAAFLIRIK